MPDVHESRVDSTDAGAPGTEIEITPEMIKAGAEVIYRCFDGMIAYGSSSGERVAALVYQAMHASRGP
jgi:hypothetical protein